MSDLGSRCLPISHNKDTRRIRVEYELFLQGVDVVSDVLLKDMSVIKYLKDLRLVMFVWGEETQCNVQLCIISAGC